MLTHCNEIKLGERNGKVEKCDLQLSEVLQLVTLYKALFDEKTENLYSVNGLSPVMVTVSVSLYKITTSCTLSATVLELQRDYSQ